MLDSCDATILEHLLNKNIKNIWLQDRMPDSRLAWWKANIPISNNTYMDDVEIRSPIMDIQMSTERFLENIKLFQPHGLNLAQLTKKVPNSLWLKSIPDSAITKVLISNGLYCDFSLPHENEIAQFRCVSEEHFEKVCNVPQVKELILNFC